DAQWAKVVTVVKPGMRDSEVTALAQYEGELLGSEQGLFRCSSAPLGEPAILRGRHYQGRTMRAGDYMTLLIENNGPGGHYAELARTFVFGKASQELRDAFTGCLQAAQQQGKNLKNGPQPRRDLSQPQPIHDRPWRAARAAAIRPQPGLRSGRAAAAARRRDHAARRQHEYGGSSGLLHPH